MIVANMATFPPRAGKLAGVVDRLLPQVDMLNIVFNEYDTIPPQYRNRPGLTPILPSEDTKDVGKFYSEVSSDDIVLLVDDDIDYPDDYVSVMVERFHNLPEGRFAAGLYASIYRRPTPGRGLAHLRRFVVFYLFPAKIARYRSVFSFHHNVESPFFVDQLGTGTAILRGENLPPYDYMRNSRRYADVRFARWCNERQIAMVALPRVPGWLSWEDDEHSIFRNFTTTHPANVAHEIRTYAFKRKFVGQSVAAPARWPQDNPAKG